MARTMSLFPRAPFLLLTTLVLAAAAPVAGSQASWPASPDEAMLDFLESMNRATDADEPPSEREDAEARAVATLDLSSVDEARGAVLARRLLGILNRLGEYRPGELWDARDIRARSAERQVYFPAPRFRPLLESHPGVEATGEIALTLQPDGRWLFSADTVAGLEPLFEELEALPVLFGRTDEEVTDRVLWLRDLMPASLRSASFLGVEHWQWVGLFAVILAGVLLDHVCRLVLRLAARAALRRRGDRAEPRTLRRAARPAGLFVMALFWITLVPALDLPRLPHLIVEGSANVFAVLAATLLAWRVVDLLADALAHRAERTATTVDDVLIPLVRTAIRIFIVIFGLIYGGQVLDIDITPLLASLTIGGVGFAFAAKDTLENFFGSATVLIDQPFGVGDWIVIGGDVEGTVEAIGFRSTRVRTFYNSLITVPNANLVRANVDNYGRRRYRRWKATIGVQYDTSADDLIAFTEGLRELVRTHPYFGASSLDILVYVFFETPDWSTELRERERLILDAIRLADELGVQFAFPTSTVHLHRHEGTEEHVPAQAPTSMSDRRAMVRGIRASQALVHDQPWREERPGPVEYREGPTEVTDDTFIEDRTSGS